MNAPHEEAVEFAKISKRENRVYVGNLSYDVKYRDLMEFMRGGGLGCNFGCYGVEAWNGLEGVERAEAMATKWQRCLSCILGVVPRREGRR
jgi:hypothetical protein